MSISKISFTAESNLLNKMYNNVSQQPPVTTPQTDVTEETAEKPKSHKVRNWSIGLSSAAVLISLGVLGRRGKLGEGVQKFLGGVKKNASDAAESLETKADELVGGKKPKAPETVEPEVFGPETRTSSETTVKPETPPKPQTGDSIRINGKLSKAEIDQINARLDRTIPQIDKNLLEVKIPDFKPLIEELNSIDVSKIKGDYAKITLSNGNTREIVLKDGLIDGIIDTSSSGEKIMTVTYSDGKIFTITKGNGRYLPNTLSNTPYVKEVNNLAYWYSPNGKLQNINVVNRKGNIEKDITVDEITGKIRTIEYTDENLTTIKKENFVDGRLAVEEFFHGAGNRWKTEVIHDLSK